MPTLSRGVPAPTDTGFPSPCPWQWGHGDTAMGIQPPSPPLGLSQTLGHGVPAKAGRGKGSAPVRPRPTHWAAGPAPGSPTRGRVWWGRGGQHRHGGAPWGSVGNAWGPPTRRQSRDAGRMIPPAPPPRRGALSHRCPPPRVGGGSGSAGFGGSGLRGAVGSTHRAAGEAGTGERAVGAAAELCRRGAGGGGREKLIIQEAESLREARESSSRLRRANNRRTDGAVRQGPSVPRPRPRPRRPGHHACIQMGTHPVVHASSRACIQSCTRPAAPALFGCAHIQLCPHPTIRTFETCTGAVHAAGCARSWMCAPSALHLPSGPPSPGRDEGQRARARLARVGRGRGTWQGCRRVSMALMSLSSSSLSCSSSCSSSTCVGRMRLALPAPHIPAARAPGPPLPPPAPHLPSAAYLNGLSPRWRHRGGGLERARGRLGVRTPRCPPASLCARAEPGPELLDFPTWCGCSSSEDFPGS